jgi:carotenoid cleavage dioxygenase-like enzyme
VREHGTMAGRGFATDPCRSIFERVASLFSPGTTDNCNVNVAKLGERWIAMTETPIAIEFDAETLDTLGPVEWENGLGEHVATAHPHHDAERGELVSYVIRFSRTSSYRVFAVPDGTRRRRPIATLPVREPAYMHSFALTDRYAVLFDQPLVVNPLRIALGNKPFIENYEWKPERGTRFLVVDRQSGALRTSVQADAFFTFHQVNALAGGTARREDLCDVRMELPRIAYRSRNGRPYRYAYAASQDGTFIDGLVKVDVGDGSVRRWQEDGCFPGEPVFVPAPGAGAEDDGVVLSVVLDTNAERSFLLVLDATGFEELGRAEAPHHIPFGFHGQFAAEEV